MAQSVEELVALGLSEAEAQRVIKRNTKAAEKSESAKARAERVLPKAQEQLDHAKARVDHWSGKAAELQAKVDKYNAVIAGESTEEVDDDEE